MDPYDAASAGPASSGWWRCLGVTATGSTAQDVLDGRLVAALTPVDPTRVTAAILTRLRDESLLPTDPAGMP